MLSSIQDFFNQIRQQNQSQSQSMEPNLAIAALLCQVMQADHQSLDAEVKVTQERLSELLNISQDEAKTLLDNACSTASDAASVYQFTDHLRDLSQQQRFHIIESMWQIAYADHKLDPIEEAVIRKAAELLYVDHQDFIRAKLKVTEQL
ncbi:MAG: TerB family tellurite resistance protein [Vibrio sp.]